MAIIPQHTAGKAAEYNPIRPHSFHRAALTDADYRSNGFRVVRIRRKCVNYAPLLAPFISLSRTVGFSKPDSAFRLRQLPPRRKLFLVRILLVFLNRVKFLFCTTIREEPKFLRTFNRRLV